MKENDERTILSENLDRMIILISKIKYILSDK